MFSDGPLDWDIGLQAYTLTVQISDGTHNFDIDVSVVLVPVNEHAPVFRVNSYDTGSGGDVVSESEIEGSSITVYTADDDDLIEPHDIVRYEIIGEYQKTGGNIFP